MGISDRDYGDFRAAYKELRDSGRLVIGAKSALTLPAVEKTLRGRFKANPRGFGFIIPDEPDARGDLFVPPDKTGGAMTDDLVVARVVKRGKRQGKLSYAGEIFEIVERGLTKIVGTLEQADGHWFVIPDGRKITTPIIVRDLSKKEFGAGTKVVIEIVEYPGTNDLPVGVIIETLGPKGQLDTEILSVVRAYGIADHFDKDVLKVARKAATSFDPESEPSRDDLTSLTVVTIDPDTARDFDDAISLEENEDGTSTLGVHIADVSHFVKEGSALDAEARRRGTSVYFPRRVIPMLPETLSNGVCSLQQGVRRFAKSAFITYDNDGNIVNSRLCESVIKSTRRLTYTEAQDICDGKTAGLPAKVVALVTRMEALARKIEARRTAQGMLHLDLREIQLVLDDDGAVVDSKEADTSYTHKIIEMFMVEANDVVAAFFAKRNIPIIRRVHPKPDFESFEQLGAFVAACGHGISKSPSRSDLQSLVDTVRDLPESYAVNLAVLRSFQKAVYSMKDDGHYALASPDYCHFTSPIRRYPDLTVHREVARFVRKEKSRPSRESESLTDLSSVLSAKERRASSAEIELKQVLVLQHMAKFLGSTFEGVITGVADFGLFVQIRKYMVEGVIRLRDLGDDWWDVSAPEGTVRGEVSGTAYRIGDLMEVQIAKVDVPMRQMDLMPAGQQKVERKSRKQKSSRKR